MLAGLLYDIYFIWGERIIISFGLKDDARVISSIACADPEGGTGNPDPPPPLKNDKNIGFLSNIAGSGALKNLKDTKQAFDDGPLIVAFGSLFPHIKMSKLDPLLQNFLDPRMPCLVSF